MKNKKLIITSISIVIIAIAAIASYKLFDSNNSQNKNKSDQIIAHFKGGVVTLDQAQTELNKIILQNPNLKGLTFNDLNTSQKEMVVKEIVLKEIAYKEAKKQRLNKTDEYQKALKLFETEFLKKKLFLKLAIDAKEEENLKKNYDELVKELENKKDYRIRYIALKTQNDANFLYKTLLKSPKSFISQAKRKSVDKETAKKGGDLGFILEDSLPVEIVDQVKILKKGNISKPFELADKWVIIKLEDERQAKVAKFEEAKEALAQSLSMKVIQDFISKSLTDADINLSVSK